MGNPEVPVGIYAREALKKADVRYGADFSQRVEARVVSEEANVRLALSKVELGEADAAIVYRTDAIASERVRAIDVPPDLDVPAAYSITVVAGALHPEAARAWVELVLGPSGRKTLVRRGFSEAHE